MTQFLILFSLLSSFKTQGQVLTASLLFSQRWHYCSNLWSLMAYRFGPASLSACVHSPSGMLTRNWPQVDGVCKAHGVLKCLIGSWRMPNLWAGLWEGFLMAPHGTFSRTHVPLIPFESPVCHSPSLFPPPHLQSCSSQFSTLPGEPSCSGMHFPGRNHGPESFLVINCAALG